MKHLPAMIDSLRVYLRLLTSRDAAEFYALTNDPKIADIISFLSYPVPRKFADEWIAKNHGTTERIYGAYLGSTLVGMIGVHEAPHNQIEIGYWVGSAHMGKGLASEMVKAVTKMLGTYCPAQSVFAECLPGNAGSRRVLEKAGFIDSGAAGERSGCTRWQLKTASAATLPMSA